MRLVPLTNCLATCAGKSGSTSRASKGGPTTVQRVCAGETAAAFLQRVSEKTQSRAHQTRSSRAPT